MTGKAGEGQGRGRGKAGAGARAGQGRGRKGQAPGQHGLALLLISQLEGLRHVQPGVLVLAVQAVAAHRALPSRDLTVHHLPDICP